MKMIFANSRKIKKANKDKEKNKEKEEIESIIINNNINVQ